MRLIIISSEFPPGPGGIGTHAYQVVKNLTNSGWEIFVISPQDYANEEEIKRFNDNQPFKVITIKAFSYSIIKFIYRWHICAKEIKKIKPHILFATGDRAIFLAATLRKYYRLPLLVVEHGRIPAMVEQKIKRWAFSQIDAVVCVSQYTLKKLHEQRIYVKTEKVIPNGGDETRFKILSNNDVLVFRRNIHFEHKNILLTVGNVTDRKGQITVIRALPHILNQEPNTHYLMVGLPTKEEEFKEVAEKLNVHHNVHFLGKVENDHLVKLMNCCDIFVMTSRNIKKEFEGYGIAAVEAALCGKPAVVTSNSGLAEAIIDGETGITVPENDEVATAHAILSLLQNGKRRRKMGEAAKKRALAEQTWKNRVKEYDALLRSLIE